VQVIRVVIRELPIVRRHGEPRGGIG